jgi:hypothetical protein
MFPMMFYDIVAVDCSHRIRHCDVAITARYNDLLGVLTQTDWQDVKNDLESNFMRACENLDAEKTLSLTKAWNRARSPQGLFFSPAEGLRPLIFRLAHRFHSLQTS